MSEEKRLPFEGYPKTFLVVFSMRNEVLVDLFHRICRFWAVNAVAPRSCIQLFRERLSEKVHATIPKGIVGGFKSTVLQRS